MSHESFEENRMEGRDGESDPAQDNDPHSFDLTSMVR
jgi:hypothetical protein